MPPFQPEIESTKLDSTELAKLRRDAAPVRSGPYGVLHAYPYEKRLTAEC
jgi:hypothetical protein